MGKVFNLFEKEVLSDTLLPVVKCEFIEAKGMTVEELWQGYKYLYAITFSYGLDFINQIADYFETMDIILGNEALVKYDIAELFAFQEQDLKEVCRRPKLIEMINSGRLEFSKTQDVHAKIFILAGEGKTRVITGSANLSGKGFNGSQLEEYECMDNEEAFRHYKALFEAVREECSTDITLDSLYAVKDEPERLHISELPITQEVKVKKAGVIVDDKNIDFEKLRFVTDVSKLSAEYASVLPKFNIKNGLILIKPEKINILERVYKEKLAEEEKRKEEAVLPEFRIDYINETCFLNGIPYDMNPKEEDVRKDISIIHKLLEYEDFYGDIDQGRRTMFMLLVYMFASPFIPRLRYIGKKHGFNTIPFPYFLILKGKRNAGKSFMVKNYQMIMFKKTFPDVNNDKFTKTKIAPYLKRCKCVPLEIEDLRNQRMIGNGKDIIKSDTWMIDEDITEHAVFVITTNEIESASSDVEKRVLFLETPIENENKYVAANCKKFSDLVAGATGAFYIEFMRRIIPIVNGMIEKMKTYHFEEGKETFFPDIFESTSEVIISIYDDLKIPKPDFVRSLTYYSFIDNADNLRAIKHDIINRWEHDAEKFKANSRKNTLEYDAGDATLASNIMQLLPMRIDASILGSKVIMNLKEAENFFGVTFCHSFIEKIIRKVID